MRLLTWVGLLVLNSAFAQGILEKTPEELLGQQQLRVLVQIQPGDFKCVDAHEGPFGQQIPGSIAFRPMEGDTGWWWNKITDYDQRVTRIDQFTKILAPEESCQQLRSEIPQSNGYYDFQRTVSGFSRTIFGERQVGTIVERVSFVISPKLILTGSHVWTDWNVSRAEFNPDRRFSDLLAYEYASVTRGVRVESQGAFLKCKQIEGRPSLVFDVVSGDDINPTEVRRVYADEKSCYDALTEIAQAIEAEGRPWLGHAFQGERRLYLSHRNIVNDECDQIRVERLSIEVAGTKFYGTNFITLGTRPGVCPVTDSI